MCGLTDILDGYLARKMDRVTGRGGQLDTIADLFFAGCTLIGIRSLLINKVLLPVILFIICIRTGIAIYSYLASGKLEIPHSKLNKVLGVSFFLAALFAGSRFFPALIWINLLIAAVSSFNDGYRSLQAVGK